ncbi:hypothetical protein BKA56DRAFT_666274 [Ilyonectria sp. MPI-CAGE-AT-0026]|nr:hypothetical protein BKA56DRAFT_666274 [Ilyonectria sp. MPI-CAGE-AT-0026]
MADCKRRPQTNWARVLKIDSIAIGLDDSFFKLGGNLITAMKLMGDARNVGVDLAVADIFRREAPVALTCQEIYPPLLTWMPELELLSPRNRL